MRGFGSKMCVFASVGALIVAGAVSTSPGSASAGVGSLLGGAGTCDPQTGETIITWTFINNFNAVVEVTSNSIVDAALIVGSLTETSGVFSPATGIPLQGTSTAITHASPDASGNVTMTLIFTPFDTSPITIQGTVSLEGCTVPPTTTVAPTTAPATTLLGSGGGSLPASGSGNTLPIVAALLTAAGLGLVLLRRRPSSADSVTN